jgi:hypothetical protein
MKRKWIIVAMLFISVNANWKRSAWQPNGLNDSKPTPWSAI